MQNFDLEWRGFSYGIQPDVDHFAAAQAFDIAGIDIYHPSQHALTGTEIAFGGDVARSLKRTNYQVVETQAQGFAHWVPYPGQLRLQAFSHLASGATMVAYWHWHSIHNSFETYWKGLLSHDLAPNPVYEEARTIGADFARLAPHLANLKKPNKVALLVSNESLTGIEQFRMMGFKRHYNDVVRLMYDQLYRMNIPCDMINPTSEHLEAYTLLIVPALYAAPDSLLERLNAFVQQGGHVVYTFKSGFADEYLKVRTVQQPGIISAACGVGYSLFVEPAHVGLQGDPFGVGSEQNTVEAWMELLTPTTAEVLATYEHSQWGRYAAITRNQYGAGTATYIGCMPSPAIMARVLAQAVQVAGLWGADQELSFPHITRWGINEAGKIVHYYFNYADAPGSFTYPHPDGIELRSGTPVRQGDVWQLDPWGALIIEEA
jgi:beta-galactosidase